MAAFDFSNSFAGINSALGDLGKRFQDRRDTNALLTAFDQSQGQQQSPLSALGQAAAPAPPAPQTTLGNLGQPQNASLIQNESGGRWNAQNNEVGAGGQRGHFGRLQFGQARLQEAAAAGAIPAGTSPTAFMASPELQQRAEAWHFGDIDQSIKANGYDRLVGQASIGGVPVTVEGLRAVAHLGGKEGMRKFVETNGAYNPADANGTRLSDYFARHGGGEQPTQVAQADMPAPGAAEAQGFAVPGAPQPATRQNVSGDMIRALLANPGTRDMGKALWQQALTGKQFGFQVVGDQLYRTNPSTGQVEPVGVSKPVQPVTVSPGQRLVDPRTGQVVYQGANDSFRNLVTPEERSQFGISAQDNRPYQVGPDGKLVSAGGAQTNVNVDTKGAGKFTEEANKFTAKRYNDMATAADEAVVLRGDIETLNNMLGQIATGRGAEARLTIAELAKGAGLDNVAAALTGGKMDEMQAVQSILDKLTPRMRVPGSGATSDMEMRTFRNSLMSLSKQPGGNQIIADTFMGMLDYQAAAGDIARQALRGEIDQKTADQAIKELPSPFSRFNEFNKARGKLAKPTIPVRIQNGMTPEMIRQRFAPGTKLILPDGSEGVVK